MGELLRGLPGRVALQAAWRGYAVQALRLEAPAPRFTVGRSPVPGLRSDAAGRSRKLVLRGQHFVLRTKMEMKRERSGLLPAGFCGEPAMRKNLRLRWVSTSTVLRARAGAGSFRSCKAQRDESCCLVPRLLGVGTGGGGLDCPFHGGSIARLRRFQHASRCQASSTVWRRHSSTRTLFLARVEPAKITSIARTGLRRCASAGQASLRMRFSPVHASTIECRSARLLTTERALKGRMRPAVRRGRRVLAWPLGGLQSQRYSQRHSMVLVRLLFTGTLPDGPASRTNMLKRTSTAQARPKAPGSREFQFAGQSPAG